MAINRRSFLRSTAIASAACIAGRGLRAAERRPASESSYKRGNTDWLAKRRSGIGIPFSQETQTRQGMRRGIEVLRPEAMEIPSTYRSKALNRSR